MLHRTRPALAGIAAALAVVAAAPAGAAPGPDAAPAPAPTSYVVENPRPDETYEVASGSVTVVDTATGTTITCQARGGFGTARNDTIPEDGSMGLLWASHHDSCAGPGADGLEVDNAYFRYGPTGYDAGADRITGRGLADLWAMGLAWPGCNATLYNVDPHAFVPMTYDNPSGTLAFGPITASVASVEGDGCAGLAEVGDVWTFETTLVIAPPAFTVRPA